jgi:hypothetical protein
MAKEKKETPATAVEGENATDSTATTGETAEGQSPASTEGATEGRAAKKTGKGSRKGQPIPIGPRRALGLGARALMSEVEKGEASITSPGYLQLQAAMVRNKYQDLRPQAERLAEVQKQLQQAIIDGDGTLISKLGKEINRIKAGL